MKHDIVNGQENRSQTQKVLFAIGFYIDLTRANAKLVCCNACRGSGIYRISNFVREAEDR